MGPGVVLFPCFKCLTPDTFGLNKFNGIPLLEIISGNVMPSSKAGHLKMSDLEIVDHILGVEVVE